MAFISGTLESLLLYNSNIHHSQRGEPVYSQAGGDKPSCTQTGEQANNQALSNTPTYTQTEHQTIQRHCQALFSKPGNTQIREPGHNQALYDEPAYTQTRELGHSKALDNKLTCTLTREPGHNQALYDKPAYTQTKEQGHDQALYAKPAYTKTKEQGHDQALYDKPAFTITKEQGYNQALYDKPAYTKTKEQGHDLALYDKPAYTKTKEQGHNLALYAKLAYTKTKEQGHDQAQCDKPVYTKKREQGHDWALCDKSAYTQTREPSHSQTPHIKLTCTQTGDLGSNQAFHDKPAYIQADATGNNQTFHKKPPSTRTREQGNSHLLFNETGGFLYSKPQYTSTRELISSKSNSSHSQTGKMRNLKFRERANRVSTASSDQLCSKEDDSWKPLGCMETDDDSSVWTTSPAISTSVGVGIPSNASDRGLSKAECRGSERHQLCSSSSLQDVIDADDPGTEDFITSQEENKTSSNLSPQRTSTSQDLSNISKARLNLGDLNIPTQSSEERVSGSKMLNEQCFQAAISEGFGSVSQTLTYKVRPGKKFSYHVHSNRLHGAKQMSMGHLTHIQKQCHWDQNSSQSPAFRNMSFSETLHSVKSTNSTYQHDSQDNLSSDSSSQNSKKDFFDKKYRYNHTALALQQSGLMKTTVKTAEILHRGKILQAELNKLRKETAIFMRSVLSNPENKHFRDLYMKLHHSKNIN